MAKITNNFVLGGVNKDADERLLPKGSVRDLLNCITNSSEGDDLGTLENVLGNIKETDLQVVLDEPIFNPEVIGSESDDSNSLIYYFVKGSNSDAILEFNTKYNILTKVLQDEKTNILKFNKRITNIDVIKKSSDSDDLERSGNLLAFSGDDNPPRIINVERCKNYAYADFLEDDINLIKPAPRKAPLLEPLNITDEGDGLEDKFLTFAYRYRYKDGYYSAISSASEYMFTPSSFNINFDTFENEGMSNIYNACNIQYNTGSDTVTDVQLLFKESTSPNWNIIEDINKEDDELDNNSEEVFLFKNNKNFKVLPESEYYRSFDNVPLKAVAQEYAGGRLMYANYEEQRDLVDKNGDKVKLEYVVSKESKEFKRTNLPTSSYESDGNYYLDIDLSELDIYSFKEEGRLDISFDIKDINDKDIFTGLMTSYIQIDSLTPYAKAVSLFNNDNLLNSIDSFNIYFEENGFSEPINTTNITFDDDNFNVNFSNSNPNILKIKLPKVLFDISNGGSEEYVYKEVNTQVNVFNNKSSTSMKSIRDYEAAMIFLDKEGRKTTALTSKENTVHIPISDSDKTNKLKVTIPETQKVPEWADRYKFAVKKVGLWETFYANRFYTDGAYRWVKLEGGDINKVNVGDDIIVKKDSDSIQDTVATIKVLDIVTHERNFIPDNTIDGTNVDIKEEPGNYIKLRPSGFSLDYSDDEIKNLNHLSATTSGFPYLIFTSEEDGIINPFARSENQDEDLPISPGTILDIKLTAQSSQDTSIHSNTYVSNANYSNIFDFLSAVNNYIPPNPPSTSSNGTEPTGYFECQDDDEGDYLPYWIVRGEIERVNLLDGIDESLYLRDNNGTIVHDKESSSGNPFPLAVRLDPEKPYVLAVKGSEGARSGGRRGRLYLDGVFRYVDGYYVFETKEKPVSDNIFYETPETFDIVNGEYQQSEHILDRYFNCYSQGNGAESYQYKDKFNANHLDVDYTPTTTSEDEYQKLSRFADITYSGVFNDNTGVNALNEFNLSTANFKEDIDKGYGAIYKIFNRDTNLLIFQEDKVSYVGLGKSQLYNADGTANVSRIENILGNQVTYGGEYGISKDSESFASYGYSIYFSDRKRGAICRLNNNGIFEISSRGMRSYFRNLFNEETVVKIIGSYDEFLNCFVINIKKDNGYYETWLWKESINERGGGWVSKQTFNPEDMVNVNGNFYSFKDGEVYRHNARDVGVYNRFYEQDYRSKFTLMLNESPENRKNFKTIDLDGSDKWKIDVKTNLKTTEGQYYLRGHVDIEDFRKEEGIYRAFIRGSRGLKEIDTNSLHVQGIGVISQINGNEVSFSNKINEELSIGDYIANTELEIAGTVQNVDGETIIIDASSSEGMSVLSQGEFVFSFKPQSIETSGLIGNHLEVSGEIITNDKTELFSVSSEVFLSNPNT